MKTIALYCGSFNPYHIGHHNVVEKVARIFGKENLYICQGINPSKDFELTNSITNNNFLKVSGYNTLIYHNFTHELVSSFITESQNTVLIKGLRNGDDLAYEDNQISFLKDFNPFIDVIYIPCDKAYEHISSSAIRQMKFFNTGIEERYILK